MSDLTGKQLGKYKVDERLAVGGMAEIYRAHSITTDVPVAIKVIHPRLSQEAKFVQMFLDEAKIVVGFDHPNIVRVFDFGRVDETYYFSMEWIDGKPLSYLVQRQLELNIEFPVEVALIIAVDALKGLHYAHSQVDRFQRPLKSIVHRDISPPNILVRRTGHSKVADFGIADASHKAIETLPGIIRGKFSYMSPEQSRGDPVDSRSDIFSVGIVLYEVLAGRRLFLRSSDAETVDAVRDCFIPPLQKERKDISVNLETIVRKALQPDRNKRYATALDFASALWFELQHIEPKITHHTVAQFMKVLYPWETFVGVDEPLKNLLRRFRDRGENRAYVIERTKIQGIQYWVHVAIGLATIVIAELLAHLNSPW